MKLSENQQISGFRVIRAESCPEAGGNVIFMEHEHTGAQVFWLDNNAENMVFSITFRTLPEDSTGVFHILEHSVLCGSSKFPMKEPFVELLKSSMNTFLNAMTFPDMTMYPVASRNPKDLMNLAEVYLDAVFAPLVMKDRKRFCQEGWHIDYDEEGNPEYRGVVFNEMKGAMSETDAVIEHALDAMLFPDTSYGYNSGGDPEEIPDLTWERFREQYTRYYHPSNAMVYLDGAVPVEEMLSLLDRAFAGFDRKGDLPQFVLQEPRTSEKTIYYELGPDEEPENKGYLTRARITGTWRDRAENMARAIICDVLTGSNEAPLKREVLERGLAKDFSLSVDDTGFQSWIALHAEHVADGRDQEILDLVQAYGYRIKREGLDKSAVEASLNRAVYHLRDEEEPQGISRCIRVMGTWLYGGNPEEALQSEEMVRRVRGYVEDGTFDTLAADMLLNTEGAVLLHTLPSETIGEEKKRKEKERIHRTVSEMSDRERADMDNLLRELEEWQGTPDREEDLATLPQLRKEDADISPEWTETETVTKNGVRILIHRLPCNGTVHLRAYFKLTDLTLGELTQASLFAGMLGRLPTRKYDALKLQQEIKRCTGNMGFAVVPRTRAGEEETCTPTLTAYVSALEENAEKAEELLAEVLGNTLLDGQESRIIDIMKQNEMGARERIISAGHTIAARKCLSSYSAEGAVKNALDGEGAICYIHSFALNPEKAVKEFVQTAGKILKESICSARMTVSVTSGDDMIPEGLANAFPKGSTIPETAVYREEACPAAGFLIPAQIGFAARGYRLSRCSMRFSGSMWLACSILSLGYYWNRIRVQGGAYGAGIQMDRTGNVFSYSFRDPTPGKTLKADGDAAAFLKDFAESGEHLDGYIISALNELNPLLSPREKGALADARMLTGYTREESERIRKEVLNTTPAQLAACGEWLNRFAAEGNVCVTANREALKQCPGLQIRDL